MVITADCGSANPGSIPGGGNFLLSLFITFNIYHFIKQTYFYLIEVKKWIGKVRVFQESEFQNIAESGSFKRENFNYRKVISINKTKIFLHRIGDEFAVFFINIFYISN